VACPFFMPTEKFENGAWAHPARLPLGCGWSGHCTAPGHEGENPTVVELQQFCNLGYAESCPRLPRERPWDQVRFGARNVSSSSNGSKQCIHMSYVCERSHLPVEHGVLEFDVSADRWIKRHPESQLQRLAECFLDSYLQARRNQQPAGAAAS
jgi:hypothetical protein